MDSSPIRKKCYSDVKKVIEDDIDARNIEISVFNWTIDYLRKESIMCNWDNPLFVVMYTEKARSVITNIDPNSYIKNTELKEKIKEGCINAKEIVFMKPETLKPDCWSHIVDEFNEKYKTAYETKEVAMTDMFRCGKCKKRECSYTEIQTRKADEPATVHVRCINCGNSWRMN